MHSTPTLDAEKAQENKDLPQAHIAQAAEAAPADSPKIEQISAEALAQQKELEQLHAERFEKKGARRAFHLVNFLGLHQIFNNVASVVITYWAATTSFADGMKDTMAHTPVGNGLSAVLSLPGKATNAMFKLVGVDPNKALNSLSAVKREAELESRAFSSQRNAIETAFMCVAGFIALAPVFWLERNRATFLNTVDNWLHPGRSKAEKEAAALTKEDEPRETLWNLLRARIIALGAVFAIDQLRTNVDSILRYNHKSQKKSGMYKNVDSVFGWGLGDKIYDAMPEGPRGWLARFFSGSLKGKNISLGGIQDETLEDVLTVTNAPQFVREKGKKIADLGKEKRLNHKNPELTERLKHRIAAIDNELKSSGEGYKAVERAVFAEQSRMFITKEVFLTTVLSAIIYFSAKSPIAAKAFEKIGLQKKGTFEAEHAKIQERKAAAAAGQPQDDASAIAETEQTDWSKREKNHPKAKAAAPAASFQNKLAQHPATEAGVSL